jgi:hypothetical protein
LKSPGNIGSTAVPMIDLCHNDIETIGFALRPQSSWYRDDPAAPARCCPRRHRGSALCAMISPRYRRSQVLDRSSCVLAKLRTLSIAKAMSDFTDVVVTSSQGACQGTQRHICGHTANRKQRQVELLPQFDDANAQAGDAIGVDEHPTERDQAPPTMPGAPWAACRQIR